MKHISHVADIYIWILSNINGAMIPIIDKYFKEMENQGKNRLILVECK